MKKATVVKTSLSLLALLVVAAYLTTMSVAFYNIQDLPTLIRDGSTGFIDAAADALSGNFGDAVLTREGPPGMTTSSESIFGG